VAIKTINPYIQIQEGSARRAIEHYERALGAKAGQIMTFGDVPGMPTPDERKNNVMHVELKIGSNVIMLCDAPAEMHPNPGDTVHIVLHFDDLEEQAKAFDALGAGGSVVMPLNDAFWGDRFGMLADPFGVRWMFICPSKKA
jgi:PhnB protein